MAHAFKCKVPIAEFSCEKPYTYSYDLSGEFYVECIAERGAQMSIFNSDGRCIGTGEIVGGSVKLRCMQVICLPTKLTLGNWMFF